MLLDSIAKSEMKVSSQEEKLTNTLILGVDKDSAAGNYQVKIWPKGSFTISSGNGFEGEADSVQISGDFQRVENRAAVRYSSGSEKTQFNASENQETRIKNKSEQSSVRRSFDYKLIAGVIILLTVITFLVFGKKISALKSCFFKNKE